MLQMRIPGLLWMSHPYRQLYTQPRLDHPDNDCCNAEQCFPEVTKETDPAKHKIIETNIRTSDTPIPASAMCTYHIQELRFINQFNYKDANKSINQLTSHFQRVTQLPTAEQIKYMLPPSQIDCPLWIWHPISPSQKLWFSEKLRPKLCL